jgi:hypothetical protein
MLKGVKKWSKISTFKKWSKMVSSEITKVEQNRLTYSGKSRILLCSSTS